MGIRRGEFEKVGPSTEVAKPALATVKMSEKRPDIGVNLRTGALALDAWSDAFGRMADTTTVIKKKYDMNQQAVYKTEDDANSARRAFEQYNEQVKNKTRIADSELEARLKEKADSMSRRAEAARKLGLFSNNFDYDRRY